MSGIYIIKSNQTESKQKQFQQAFCNDPAARAEQIEVSSEIIRQCEEYRQKSNEQWNKFLAELEQLHKTVISLLKDMDHES